MAGSFFERTVDCGVTGNVGNRTKVPDVFFLFGLWTGVVGVGTVGAGMFLKPVWNFWSARLFPDVLEVSDDGVVGHQWHPDCELGGLNRAELLVLGVAAVLVYTLPVGFGQGWLMLVGVAGFVLLQLGVSLLLRPYRPSRSGAATKPQDQLLRCALQHLTAGLVLWTVGQTLVLLLRMAGSHTGYYYVSGLWGAMIVLTVGYALLSGLVAVSVGVRVRRRDRLAAEKGGG